MEENNGIKIAHVINLPTLNVKSQISMNADSNAHIKRVLNVEACLIDAQIEPLFNKAIVKGTVGIKAMYLDDDNMYGSMSDTATFSETIVSDNITSDCQININNTQFFCEFDTDGRTLKVAIDGTIDCICNLNAAANHFNQVSDRLVVKKSVVPACSCLQKINKEINVDFEFKLDQKINKMLSCDSKVIVEECKCFDGYVVVSGNIINTIICEIYTGEASSIKVINNSTPFRSEVEAQLCDSECVPDLAGYVNLNSTPITTDIGESNTQFNFEYCVVISGYIYKTINMDVMEDVYNLDHEIEVVYKQHSICKKSPQFKSIENVDAEITLADELNVDEILGLASINSSVTQYLIKDGSIAIEGVISGNLLYLDENKEIKNMPTQIPYSINVKQEILGDVCAAHLTVTPISYKCKVRRGNSLMIDYEVCVTGHVYTQTSTQLIDSIKYGKAINYGDIAFQIYVAHPNESCWDLCKRLHITREKLLECNKENPTTYSGGEKIIVYR